MPHRVIVGHAARQRNPAQYCAREQRDQLLMPQIQLVWHTKFQVYGADKIWRHLNREGVAVARCTIERLINRLQIRGARHGKIVHTTIPDETSTRQS